MVALTTLCRFCKVAYIKGSPVVLAVGTKVVFEVGDSP